MTPAATTRPLRWVACLLLACWVVLLVWFGVVGIRPSTLERLETDLRAGEVTSLETWGGLGGPDAIGYSHVDLVWSTGWTQHRTTAVEATPGRQTRRAHREQSRSPADRAPVVEPGLRDRLAALDPTLRVRDGGQLSSHGTLFGWQTPLWSVWALLVLWLGTFSVVMLQPRPVRATRAAWTWLVLLGGPIGTVGYLVLGGPAGLLGPPPAWRRPLTGGWAFLLACVLGGATQSGG